MQKVQSRNLYLCYNINCMVKEQKELTINKLRNELNIIASDLESSDSLYAKDKYVKISTIKNKDDTYSLLIEFLKPVKSKTKTSIINVITKYINYLYKKEKIVNENKIIFVKKYIKDFIINDKYENYN